MLGGTGALSVMFRRDRLGNPFQAVHYPKPCQAARILSANRYHLRFPPYFASYQFILLAFETTLIRALLLLFVLPHE